MDFSGLERDIIRRLTRIGCLLVLFGVVLGVASVSVWNWANQYEIRKVEQPLEAQP